MLSSKTMHRPTLSLMAALLAISLTACGYRPLYGTNPSQQHTGTMVNQHLAAIQIKPIKDRAGQMMRTTLSQKLAPTASRQAKVYDLYITLDENLATLAVEESAFATRANLGLRADYRLVRVGDGLELLQGSTKTVSSYNIVTSDFATIAAKDDARERAIENLAAAMRTRLAVYFNGPGRNIGTSTPEQRNR